MRRAVPILTWLAVGLVALAPSSSVAQGAGEMTVDELVARALSDNPDLKAARIDVEAASARVQQAGLRPNPMLEIGGQKAISPDNNLNIGVSLPLDLNGRKAGRVGVAEREVDLKRRQVADRERRLRADIRMKAGEVLAARRSLGVIEDLAGFNRDALSAISSRVREGAAPSLDENIQLVEVNRLDAGRQLAQSRVEITTLQLKALAGMPADAPLLVKGELTPSPLRLEQAEAMQRSEVERPDVAAAQAEAAMASAMVKKEQADGRWDASVSVGYQRQDTGFNLNGLTSSGQIRPIQDVFHYFGGAISITLPVRNANEGSIAAARAAERAAERRVEFAMLTAQQEVAAAFTQYEAARRALELYERGVRDVARRNLDVVRRSYGLGRGSLLDVVAEQRRYIEIESGYTDALKQVYDASVEIERAVGVPGR